MAILISNVSNALQKVIQPYIQDNYNKLTPLLDQIKKQADVEFFNNNFYAPIRTSRHSGIVALANDGSTLRTGAASIGQANVGVRTMTGTFDISKLVMAATKNRKGAVENQLTFQAKTLLNDFSKDINRQYYSDGVGVLSQVASSVGAGTLSVTAPDSNLDDGNSIDWYGTVNGDISPTKYLQVGMAIAIGTAGADVGTITSINNNTVVVTGAPVIAANDTIYKVDGDEAGAGTSEIQGIRAALSSTTGTSLYAGVARSTTGWTPQLGTVSEQLTLSKMEDIYVAATEFADAGDQYAIFVNKSLYTRYGNILTSLRREVNKTDLLGGWKGLAFTAGLNDVGVFLDYEVPDGEVEIINLTKWTSCEVEPMSWLEGPEGGLIRRRDAITYQATMVWFTNLLCRAPGANGRLTQKTA